jgi:threonine aldolase
LSAPVGSVLCGEVDFIYRAHRVRKLLGGGMRQAGIIAAAGIVALETMTERLREDHVRARRLAEGIASITGLEIDLEPVQSNIVYFSVDPDAGLTAKEIVMRLRERDVLIGQSSAQGFRAVTHCWIDDADIERTLAVLRAVLESA